VQLKTADKGLMQSRVGENRQDIFEQNSRRREVGELAQSGAQAYFKIGEFGGAGGRGGGLSDLGGGIRLLGRAAGWLRHGEKKEERRKKERKGKKKKKNKGEG
jgi:hypothetical protein